MRRVWVGFAVCLFAAAGTVCVCPGGGTAKAGQAVELLVENDFFTPDRGDRYYSNGLQGTFIQWQDDLSVPGRWLSRGIFGPGDDEPDRFVTERLSLAQTFFTPENIELRDLQPDDHPWASWLRLSYSLSVRHDGILDTGMLSLLGVVGPLAQGEPVQRWWHSVINDPTPRGWNNQLKNEPVAQFLWERKWRRLVLVGTEADLGLDLRPVTEIALGNAFIHGGAGLEIRFGRRLRSDGGIPRPGPNAPSLGAFIPREDGYGWYVFAAAQARGVGRNLFIEGNTFRDSPGLDVKRFANDVIAGAAIETPRVRFSYTFVSRSEEFDGQNGRHEFGQLGITFAF